MNTRNHLSALSSDRRLPCGNKNLSRCSGSNGRFQNGIPNEIEAHYGISHAYQAQNNFEKAEYHVMRGIALLEARALSMRSGTRSSRSRRVERYPLAESLRDARYTLAQIYILDSSPKKAVQAFAKILATDANDVQHSLVLGWLIR